ncbi:hypothetical protein DFH09DRAFT_1116153 [Mycena vulgaris]|nr:hypothetical protein DFH09DRAFT_1116153 [Mycena vulgaris]
MCGLYTYPFEAGLAFGAEFEAVVDDALVSKDGEHVPDDGPGVLISSRSTRPASGQTGSTPRRPSQAPPPDHAVHQERAVPDWDFTWAWVRAVKRLRSTESGSRSDGPGVGVGDRFAGERGGDGEESWAQRRKRVRFEP